MDCYGAVRKETGVKGLVLQLYQGQMLDEETGLAYNRFRYYDNEAGNYISQDPIKLSENNPTLYGYVKDVKSYTDIPGLDPVFDEHLASIARKFHDVLRDTQGNPTRGFNNSTVAVAEGKVNGETQLFASGNGASLTPAQRAVLVEHGMPEQNIFSGAKFRDADKLTNRAEKVIIRNVPEGTKLTGK